MKFFVSIIVGITLLLACSKNESEEEIQEKEPVATVEDFEIPDFQLAVKVFEEGGAELTGSASELSASGISEYGFLISERQNPEYDSARKVNPDNLEDNVFSALVEDDLKFNTEYFVIAYIKSLQGSFAYTEIKSFISTGSIAPMIRSIPAAHIGDTVQIRGDNFTEIAQNIFVGFDEEYVKPIESSDTTITCIIPETLKRFDPKVTVKIYGKSGVYEDFALYQPIVEGLSDTSVSIGDTLTVYGRHFDFENERNSILIDGKQAEILSSSKDSIRFVIPSRLSVSDNAFALTTQLQTIQSEIGIVIKPPVITEVPALFRSYEIIEIQGDEFSPVPEENKIWFDEHQAVVMEASKNILKVRVPIGPYADGSPDLRIELMDYSYKYTGELAFKDTWLLYKELPDNYFRHFVTKDNILYVFTEDDANARFLVKRLDSGLNLLSSFYVDYPRTSIRDDYFSILYNSETGRAFFYFLEEEANNFYEFRIDSHVFEVRSNYPDIARGGATIFSIGETVYMGLGSFPDANIYSDYKPYAQFWGYDVTTDTWQRVADFPGYQTRRLSTSVFVINNEGYVGNGANSTGVYDFWKFTASSNEWTRVDNFPDVRKNTASFGYNGYGYVVFGGWLSSADDMFKYDPQLDDWLEMDDVNEFYFQDYGRAPEHTMSIQFSNAIYLIVSDYPDDLCFKADLQKL